MSSGTLLALVQALALAGPAQDSAAPEPPRATAVWVDADLLRLDGDGSEWAGARPPDVVIDSVGQLVALLGRPPGELWSGADDASLRLWTGWTEEDLVLAGDVRDEVGDYEATQWYRGDSLELFLNVVDRDPEWGEDDFQVMLAPDWPERPWGVYNHGGALDRGIDGGFGGVEIASRSYLGGYRFEARIPWVNFAGYRPAAGDVLPFNFALCDRDGRGPLESYGTWTGEAGIAAFADRRGLLELAPPPGREPGGASSAPITTRPRLLLLLLIAASYAVALLTRRVWRTPRARMGGLLAAALVLLAAAGAAWMAHAGHERELNERRADVGDYGMRFADLVRAGVLGHPGPEVLRERAGDLLAGRSIAPIRAARFVHLVPPGAELDAEARTARRGLPFRRILPGTGPAALPDVPASELGPEDEVVLLLPEVMGVDAVQLVTVVEDPRSRDAGAEEVSVLAVELLLGEEDVQASRELRHRQDLHHNEDEHEDRSGAEPAFYQAGGRLGRLHGDGLLLELEAVAQADRLRVRRIGPTRYDVRLVAVAVRTRGEPALPAGMREDLDGNWIWEGHRPEIRAEVTAPGRAPRASETPAGSVRLALGSDAVGALHLFDLETPRAGRRWDSLPLGALVFLAPFLVALMAEWLATQRRIRGKLAVGFAVSSAVPLLALTLLLEASLGQEHERGEARRANAALARAEGELDRLQRELDLEARRLLRIVELEHEVSGAWPADEAALARIWPGDEGELRMLERTAPDGRRRRLGSGSRWREVPAGYLLESGLLRPFGRLYACGVARTKSGASEPLTVVVAREPPLSGALTGAGADGALADDGAGVAVKLLGAGRDPQPTLADLAPPGPRELRRPLYGPKDNGLIGVLVARWGERGDPVLGDYTLTELLLAAGLSALFTALLFAGILTGHLVGPIERLDRAVREGRAAEVRPEVDDEVGHLARAIRSASSEIDHRLKQLETLQVAQEDLSRQLDADRAREAVLRLFDMQAGARALWLSWAGESGGEPRLFCLDERAGVRSLNLPRAPGLLVRSLSAGHVLRFQDEPGLPALGKTERSLFANCDSILSLPLLAAGGTRGALLLGYARSDRAPDLAFLRAASAQAAIVLENARLYQQAVSDGVTGFLFDPGFRQRLAEEIQRAEHQPQAGVLVVKLRLGDLPADDVRASERLREAARRMRLAARGMALFGRAGSSDLSVALPWTGPAPALEDLEARLVESVARAPWPDGEEVTGLFSAHAAWPLDGPSARFVLQRAEERLAAVQSGAPDSGEDRLRERLPPDFVAGAPNMVQMLETVRRLAKEEVSLLITGETGTGKDRVAELAHRWSPRAAGPLVHVHCPSLSETLIEDELFGHMEGAFTGAETRRISPFEFAAGGTVVLDEVGGLSADGQVALLRVLENREVLPLGAHRPVPIDVRVVATSSRDLAQDVEDGRFRGDLYFRLNVAQVTVPPLRLRRQALPELVEAFVQRFNEKAPRPVTGLDSEVLDLLHEHDWPGNVRELENTLAGGLILAAGGELRREHVRLEPSAGEAGGSSGFGLAGLNPRQRALLRELPVGAALRSSEHAARHEVSGRTALRDLMELAEAGWLVREGQRRGTRFRRTRTRLPV